MRDYELIIPSDCVTTINAETHGHALRPMQSMLKANIWHSSALLSVTQDA